MNDTQEEINKIYQEIIDLIWDIFPENGLEAYFDAQIFSDTTEYTFYWLNNDGDEEWYKFGEGPYGIYDKIEEQLKKLQQHKLFEKERWTHCKITVTNDYKLNIKFAYISQDDSLPSLYMKGLNELSQEEAYNKYGVPKEEWEKRQKFKENPTYK